MISLIWIISFWLQTVWVTVWLWLEHPLLKQSVDKLTLTSPEGSFPALWQHNTMIVQELSWIIKVSWAFGTDYYLSIAFIFHYAIFFSFSFYNALTNSATMVALQYVNDWYTEKWKEFHDCWKGKVNLMIHLWRGSMFSTILWSFMVVASVVFEIEGSA